MTDVLDILEINENAGDDPDIRRLKKRKLNDENRNEDLFSPKKDRGFKKPEGMSRELYALLSTDQKDGPPIIPTEFSPNAPIGGGYKQAKAKLGLKKVRPWKWMPFLNAGRSDDFKLYHWRRIADEGKEYPFAGFNKKVPIPSYNDSEYQQYLQSDNWTKPETDHLFALCRQYDLRFIVIHDRWDRATFTVPRSVEDLKERYYNVYNLLSKARTPSGQEVKIKYFDADHERKRKEQLAKLFDRTTEQVEEEQKLLEELRKIEMRKKEREKKTQDLQKLITAADKNSNIKKSDTSGSNKTSSGPGRPGPGRGRKRISHLHKNPLGRSSDPSSNPSTPSVLDSVGIRFPEIKSSGVSLRSHRMKLPGSVGTKKSKAIEQLLTELNVDLKPMPKDEICQHFNELRSDMVLLYELKSALATSEFELQTLKHQVESLQTGKPLESLIESSPTPVSETSATPEGTPKKTISEVIEVDPGLGTPTKKRKAALEQGNLMRKLKKM